jgi:nucleoside-diphosphate-sugar epimerase
VNIASGNPLTIREVIETLADHIGRSQFVDFDVLPTPANDPPRLTASVQRLKSEVQWAPSLSLQAGIADTVSWWRKQGQ